MLYLKGMETIKVNTSQHIEIDYPVAGLGERISARMIDLAVLVGVFILLSILFLMVKTIFLFILAGVIYAFYNLVCELLMNGQSIGKRLMKIKVISIDGGQPSIGQYFIRWIFRLVDFALTGQIGAVVCIALSKNKQRIGDIVAGTTVVKTVPYTKLEDIAFHPSEIAYTPVFLTADELKDSDVELIHEVISVYYKTGNTEIVYTAAAKITGLLAVKVPEGMNELEFLQTVVKDYNHITSAVAQL